MDCRCRLFFRTQGAPRGNNLQDHVQNLKLVIDCFKSTLKLFTNFTYLQCMDKLYTTYLKFPLIYKTYGQTIYKLFINYLESYYKLSTNCFLHVMLCIMSNEKFLLTTIIKNRRLSSVCCLCWYFNVCYLCKYSSVFLLWFASFLLNCQSSLIYRDMEYYSFVLCSFHFYRWWLLL